MMDENVGWGIDANQHRLRTTDGGYTWQNVSPSEIGFFYANDPTQAWEIVPTLIPCEITPVLCSDDWTLGLAAWQTLDGGQTWQMQGSFNYGRPMYQPLFMQFANDKGWFLFLFDIGMTGSSYETLMRTVDGGKSWIRTQFNPMCLTGGMIMVNEQEGWVGDDCHGVTALDGVSLQEFVDGKETPSLMGTSDGGNTWYDVPVPAPTVLPSSFPSPDVDLNADDPIQSLHCGIKKMDKISQEAFILQWSCWLGFSAAVEFQYAYLTPDGGQTWHSWLSTGNETFTTPNTGWRVFLSDDDQPNSLQQTTDGGLTWSTIKSVTWQTAQFDFVSEQVGWAIVSDSINSALVHTIDGGKTWIETEPVIAP
jgi:photosystem II stability/assembly factor-like uncharacterized protein